MSAALIVVVKDRFPEAVVDSHAYRGDATLVLRSGSLLGVARDALLGVDILSFVATEDREAWWTQFDAVTEGSEPSRFRSRLLDARGASVAVECSVTRFAQRGRTLALVIARPV